MNQQNIQHSVSLEAILKISRTHSCKISSSVEQGQVQWSSEKVPFMELLLACFVMLLWGVPLVASLTSIPSYQGRAYLCTTDTPILFRNQPCSSWGKGVFDSSLARRVQSWWFMVIPFPLSVIGLGISLWLIILAYETERKPAKEASKKFSVVFKIHAKKDVSSEVIGCSVS